MARPSTFLLLDRLIDGGLEDQLRERRAAGDSFADIARWVLVAHGYEVDASTIRRWCIDRDIEKADPERASA